MWLPSGHDYDGLSDGTVPSFRYSLVDQLAKQAAEIALRLAALPADGLRNNLEALNCIEELAMRILKEVSAVRSSRSHPVGETRGMWPAMQPARRQ
ncbi:MAG: hypothetical protein NTW28_10250 [Candidatus Solibacter sp.]|nr:hypothetical protein [Candidatus Solibacter sp.]